MVEIVNTDGMHDGREVEQVLGMVRGNTVEAKNAGRDLTQSIRNFFGGELKAYTDLLTKSREKSIQEAKKRSRRIRCRCNNKSSNGYFFDYTTSIRSSCIWYSSYI